MISSNYYPIICALVSNILAQIAKTIVYYYRAGKWDIKWVIQSGGFPSSHSSTVTSLSIAIGILEGFDSALFQVTCVFSLIVMYDACNVRYYSGKNIELTQQLIKDFKEFTGLKMDDPIYKEKLKTILGHKGVEVLGGFILGLLIPFLLIPLFLK